MKKILAFIFCLSLLISVDTMADWTNDSGINPLWTIDSNGIYATNTARPGMVRETPSATNPSLLPQYADSDTGIGLGAADAVSIISGGVEAVRYTEDSTVTRLIPPKEGAAHGGYTTKVYSATSGGLTGATDTIELAIPSGWRIIQCQLHVKTAVVDSAGDDTWSAELNDGGTEEALAAGAAAAQNTNVNHWAVADTWGTLTDAETDILLTPNGGNFSSGEIEAHCIAAGFSAWSSE